MSTYSIKDIEQMCGIKAHTIRIWEQRYSIICPKRTDSNIRYYTDEDLKRLMNIALLNRHGHRISKIAKMDQGELCKKVAELTSGEVNYCDQIDSLVLSMLDLDTETFVRIFEKGIEKHGLEHTMVDIIYPFLFKIGMLWQTGSISPLYEHFISQIIIGKLRSAIEGLGENSQKRARRFLLFLPEEEMHEIGILFAHYIIKREGHRVIYLGQHMPLKELSPIKEIGHFEAIFTSITNIPREGGVREYVSQVAKTFPDSEILVSGYQTKDLGWKGEANVTIVKSLADLMGHL